MKTIEDLAREAGFLVGTGRVWADGDNGRCDSLLERFAALIRAQALEEAAAHCDSQRSPGYVFADAIRALAAPSLGAPASPSGSTLQPPSGASASIPSAKPDPHPGQLWHFSDTHHGDVLGVVEGTGDHDVWHITTFEWFHDCWIKGYRDALFGPHDFKRDGVTYIGTLPPPNTWPVTPPSQA